MKKCEYCETVHPDNQASNPHYCIARLSERVEKYEAALAERDRTIAEWKAAWETENAAVKKAEREIAELKAERDKAIEDVTILTQQRRNLLDERATLKGEIKQWELIAVAQVEENERLKAEVQQWKDLAFAQGMKLKMGEAHDET